MNESKKELSCFLPDGWEWKQDEVGRWYATGPRDCICLISEYGWRERDLLLPSEGGGFQRMKSLKELTLRGVDIIYRDGFIDFNNSGYSKGDPTPIGWRPRWTYLSQTLTNL